MAGFEENDYRTDMKTHFVGLTQRDQTAPRGYESSTLVPLHP